MGLSTTNWLFVGIVLLYAAVCGLFVLYLARGGARIGKVAKGLLGLVLLMQFGFLLSDAFLVLEGVRPDRVQHTLTSISMLVAVGYLLAAIRYRVTVLGAFVAPISLLLFLGAGLRQDGTSRITEVQPVLLPIHIALSILGIVAFAFAAVTAAGYLLQEHLLRTKRLGGVFARLPALDTLDRLGFRLSLLGFPLLMAGIAIGSFWILQRPQMFWELTASQGFAFASWLVFGAVIALRVAAGWSGGRAAIGILVGFGLSVAVLFGYALGSSASATGSGL